MTLENSQHVHQVNGESSALSDSVRDVNGGFIADSSTKVERWGEHFEHHLNCDGQFITPLFSSPMTFIPSPTYAVPCDHPSETQVANAIRRLSINKELEKDGILAEIYKCRAETLAHWLHELTEQAWRDGVVPDDWGSGILVPILKKGDKTRCADQVLTLRRILEFRHSYQQLAAVCIVEFAAVFDSVHHETLWRIMALDGVLEKVIAIIKAYYRSITATVLVRNNLSQPFGIRSGARQGCILSLMLFNYAVDWILWRDLHEGDVVELAPSICR
nr:unnamed protein product [Spirometra erinaceieuropaei]